jgi:hypothetical protein
MNGHYDKVVLDNLARSTEHCRALLASLTQRLNADVKIKKAGEAFVCVCLCLCVCMLVLAACSDMCACVGVWACADYHV